MTNDKDKIGATFVGQIYDIRTKRDGGGRIAIDFGADGLDDVQYAQKLASKSGCVFQVALVPIQNPVFSSASDDEFVPNEFGEIELTKL